MIRRSLCLFILHFLVVAHIAGHQMIAAAQQAPPQTTWEMYSQAGFPAWIVSDNTYDSSRERKVFVYVEASEFTRENIRNLFINLAVKYDRPIPLQITAYSDKENLYKAIRVSQMNYYVDFDDTPEGQAAAREWRSDYWPASKGYLRSQYYRTYREERYNFCSDPQSEDCIEIVLKKEENPEPAPPISDEMANAISEDNVIKVKELLSKEPYANKKDARSAKLLFEAIRLSKDDMVKLLLDSGIDQNSANPKGVTALMLASENGRVAAVEELLARGAFVDDRTATGNTPLLRASEHGHTEIVRLLLSYGANPNARSNAGSTPLILAHRHQDVVKMLLDNGAEIDAQDKDGMSSLMYAIWTKSYDSARLLLERGADVLLKNNSDQTAFDLAVITGSRKSVDLLNRERQRRVEKRSLRDKK